MPFVSPTPGCALREEEGGHGCPLHVSLISCSYFGFLALVAFQRAQIWV